MNNYVRKGETLTLTAPAGGVVSGTGYLIGGLFVVAQATVAATLPFAAMVTGVFNLPRDAADAAWVEGDRIFWDADAGKATTSGAGDNTPIGYASTAALSAAVLADVRLDGIGASAASLGAAQGTAIYDHNTDVGTNVLVPAAGYARQVFVFHEITETFAATTTEPIMHVGSVADPDEFAAVVTGAAGVQGFTTGVLPANESLDVVVTDGTGGSEAGKLKVSAFVVG